ncbi:MAG: DUF4199 domain-containing protein [Flavobacteriales bacterium]|nr:DUF4199 domain-containing protein [Flavobacteriales bacterium]
MKNNLIQTALKFGLIVGAIQIVFTLLLYVLGLEYLSSWGMSFLGIAIFLTAMCVSSFQLRKTAGGFIEFKSLIGKVLIVFIGAMALSTIFNILLYNVIDTNLAGAMQEAQIEQISSFMEGIGAEDDDIDKAIQPLDNFADQFSVANLSVGFIWSIVWGVILASILAAIFKKNKNPFEEDKA